MEEKIIKEWMSQGINWSEIDKAEIEATSSSREGSTVDARTDSMRIKDMQDQIDKLQMRVDRLELESLEDRWRLELEKDVKELRMNNACMKEEIDELKLDRDRMRGQITRIIGAS